MSVMEISGKKLLAVGYSRLIELYGLNVIPHYRKSYIALIGRRYTEINNSEEMHVYPKEYRIDADNVIAQLEFALKYDGINLEILTATFREIEVSELTRYILNSPTGKYTRLIWFLYEWLMDDELNIEDVNRGNYVVLLDDKKYYVTSGSRSKRHRVINNLLGNRAFCPMIRKTDKLIEYEKLALDQQANALIESYDPKIVERAAQYLFTKETISSYKIERETPSKKREERYVSLLESAHKISELTKDLLVKLQQATVEKRFSNYDYRTDQNYVGETINPYLQKIHYISPKPEDVNELMEGMISCLEYMIAENIYPVVIAATIAFAFVFIHPFDDGNGRLHRFLIHYALSRTGFTPAGIIFPVSAVMVDNMNEYDGILESFSKPLMSIVKYEQYPEGEISVKGETILHYQYIDYTRYAEYLFTCVQQTISTSFQTELDFLVNYDAAKIAIRDIVDMPDRLIDLIIKFIFQNQGKLSNNKRSQYFDKLTDDEIKQMEAVVSKIMGV